MIRVILLAVLITSCTNSREQITVNEYYVLSEDDAFSKEQVIDEIKVYNFKYPYIILAQAILESGNFTSKRFKTHNNMFGMKIAKSRTTCAQKDIGDYAYYSNWRMSIVDRALYETTYLRKSKSESDYLSTICLSYAEDVEYKNKILKIIRVNNLKEKFQHE